MATAITQRKRHRPTVRYLRQTASGVYYLEFNGVAHQLEFTNGITGAANHTVCYTGFGASSSESIINLGQIGSPYSHRTFSSEIAIRVTGGAEVYSDTNTNLAVITHILDGTLATDNRAFKNGLELMPTTQSAGSTLTTTSEGHIGNGSVGGVSEISFYEAVTIDRAVTSTEQESLEAYMARTVGIDAFYDVVVLAGQSNMRGTATYDENGGHATQTYQWNSSDELQVAPITLDHPFTTEGFMGPDISFSDSYRANSSRRLLFRSSFSRIDRLQ